MKESPGIVALEREESSIALTWSDGRRDVLHYIWLRDNGPDAFHSNGQRVLDTFSLPENPVPEAVEAVMGGGLEIRWADGPAVPFTADFLRRHGWPGGNERPERPRPWTRDSWSAGLPREKFKDVSQKQEALRRWLRAVKDFGFVLLDEVPLRDDSLPLVVDLFGYVRETNYGDYWDVRTLAQPNNLAFTGMALGVHTDNPYRNPVPTVQILMCMEADLQGGDSILVDGFAAAEALRETKPDHFRMLTETPVRFHFRDEGVELEDEKTIIALDEREHVKAVHFNNRSLAPFQCGDVPGMYRAYRAFADLLYSSEFEIRFRLEPGSLFLVDNRRVLHGRTALTGAGRRRLRGCYADIDGLYSKLAVLERLRAAEVSA